MISVGILSMSTTLYAQFKVGLLTGITSNTLDTSTKNRPFGKYESRSGFTAAIPLQYHFNDWFALGADLSYIEKNYSWSRTGFYEGIGQTTTNSYIQLPLMTRFSFGGERLRGFTNLGGYVGYWINSNIQGVALDMMNNSNPEYEYNEKYTFDKRRDNRVELGLLASIGIEYIWNRYSFFLEARYYHGMTDLQKNYMINQIPRYNKTVAVQVGCMFDLFHFSQK